MILHALQRCQTRTLGKTVCGLAGIRVHNHRRGRRKYKGVFFGGVAHFMSAGPEDVVECERCLFVISKRTVK